MQSALAVKKCPSLVLQIYNMREMNDELSRLLGVEESSSLGVAQVWLMPLWGVGQQRWGPNSMQAQPMHAINQTLGIFTAQTAGYKSLYCCTYVFPIFRPGVCVIPWYTCSSSIRLHCPSVARSMR